MGDSDWKRIMLQLLECNYRGDIVIEGFHDPVYCGDREMEGQMMAFDYLKQCRLEIEK